MVWLMAGVCGNWECIVCTACRKWPGYATGEWRGGIKYSSYISVMVEWSLLCVKMFLIAILVWNVNNKLIFNIKDFIDDNKCFNWYSHYPFFS